MKIYHLLVITCLSIFGIACKSQQELKEEKSVNEITSAPPIRNSDIIRSPVSAQQVLDTNNVAKMTFEEPDYDFGEVEEGSIVDHVFTFTNTGNQPLLISNARSTCGCTVPQWPKDPIAPGSSGSISVRFNTDNKAQKQVKPITITANTYPSTNKVYLRGVVNPKEDVQ